MRKKTSSKMSLTLSSIRRYYDENTRLFLAFGSGRSVTSIHRAVWADGSIHYVSARGMLARDDMGQPQRINGIIWDITEQGKA